MKSVLLILAGAADTPLPIWDGRTALETARTPHLDALAENGRVGGVWTVTEGASPELDTAALALLGYDPARYYRGRGPLEAAAVEAPLEERDIALCASLTSSDGERLLDPTAGNPNSEEVAPLVERLREKLTTPRLSLFPVRGHRLALRWSHGSMDIRTVPPSAVAGEPFPPFLPEGEGVEALHRLIWDSLDLLFDHPVNRRRRDEGKPPANLLWPWGQGLASNLPDFFGRWRQTGVVLSDEPVVLGVSRSAGLKAISLPEASDTPGSALAATALDLLDRRADFLGIYLSAPANASLLGDPERKIYELEALDRLLVGPLLSGLKKRENPFRLLVVPDRKVSTAERQPLPGPVPFLLYDSLRQRRSVLPFDERSLEDTTLMVAEGHRLLPLLLTNLD